jgi:murein DD-endopeptidase MepM/ murein hydrolase activator NlpD
LHNKFTLFKQDFAMKRVLFSLLVVGGVLPIVIAFLVHITITSAFTGSDNSTNISSQDTEADLYLLEAAIYEAIQEESEHVLGLLVNQSEVINLQISQDNSWGVAWLVLSDQETGERLPIEPGLVLAQQIASKWRVFLPSDREWFTKVQSAPSDLLPDTLRQAWLEIYTEATLAEPAGAIGGYLLPWKAGETAWLSQSVAHDKYTPSGSAHYAFDFYVPQTMFDIYAAKSGRVWLVRWDVPNGDKTDAGNYLVLEDTSTYPTTYQLYLHLAYESVPPALREPGAHVTQGQFIAIADDTGQSTGHHLHFHVHTNPSSYWGFSVDITFDDVPINGGRPRVDGPYFSDLPWCRLDDVCDEFQSAYISGNIPRSDPFAPVGGLFQPIMGETLASGTVLIEGWASDEDSGIDTVQIIAKYDGDWKEIGPKFTEDSFSYEWDMCSADVLNGPVSLALQIRDKSGNEAIGLPGLTHFTKDHTCPSPLPGCIPSQDQIALFTRPNYSGVCLVLDIGQYSGSSYLGPLGNDKAASILVGDNVLATLYSGDEYSGRSETFTTNNSNLLNNLVGTKSTSSLRVREKANYPFIPWAPIAPLTGINHLEGDSLSLAWRVPTGGVEFQVELNGPPGTIYSPWLSEPVWNLTHMTLPQGAYNARVKARNSFSEGGWSQYSDFNIIPNPATPDPPEIAPVFYDMEDGAPGWTSSGLWHLGENPERAYSPNSRWYFGIESEDLPGNYADGTPNYGSLTSPLIYLPDPEIDYSLRFWYYYQTESPSKHWDRRWVQISQDGGPFENVLQLYNDLPDSWLHGILDLSDYNGSIIQVRFYFETLDDLFNEHEGWYIDDFEISTDPFPNCGDNDPELIPINYGEEKSGVICYPGDIDTFSFQGNAGDRIMVALTTPDESPQPDLDFVITLLDEDGASLLAEYDQDLRSMGISPHLGYLMTRSGTYYIQVRHRLHPTTGGSEFAYNIHLIEDNQAPEADFIFPDDEINLPPTEVDLLVLASEGNPHSINQILSGLSHVEFLWHSGDWLNDDWVSVGKDWDGPDIWSIIFDAENLDNQKGMAFYANVYDWAGNWTGKGVWNVDRFYGYLYIPLVHKNY